MTENCGGAVTVTCGVTGPQGPPGSGGPVGVVLPVSSSQALTETLSSTLFTNDSATAEIDLTLPGVPTPFAPLAFSMLVTSAQQFGFVAPAGVVITNGIDSSSPGGSLKSNVVGNFVTIVMVSASKWIITNIAGLWNFA